MFLRRILSVAAVAALYLLTGCSAEANQSAYEKVQEKLTGMTSYQATAEVKYISNKNTHTYETRQYARTSGEYRIEVIGPDSVAGNTTIFDGKVVCQFNSAINSKIMVGTAESAERTEILLTTFIRNYLKSKDVSVSAANIAGGDCTVLEAKISGDHPYMASEKLWINNSTLKPVQLVIYDKNGAERIVVTYMAFEYNITLDDILFTVIN